jgi:hypothetical protein
MPNGPLLEIRALGSLGDVAPIDYLRTAPTRVQEHQPSIQPKAESRNGALCARLRAATLGLGPDTGRQAHDGYPEGTE